MKVGDKYMLTVFSYPYAQGEIVTVYEIRGENLFVTEQGFFVSTNDCRPYMAASSDPIVESVINQFKTRSEVGIKKYGTTLGRNDLSTLDWLKHLQEEMMDAVLYIERLKQEFKTKE